MSEFKPGDKVKDRGGEEYTIEFGPYDSVSGPSYLVKDAAGTGYPCAAKFLSAVPPADPRVDVVARAIAESDGEPFDVSGTRNRDFGYRRNARAVLAALDAMPQAPRRVRDRDGDVWEESDWGTWIGVTFPADTCGSYRELAEEWGPLTDV